MKRPMKCPSRVVTSQPQISSMSVAPAAVEDLLHALGAFQMVVVGDGDHPQATLARFVEHALRAGRAVAEVGVHVQVGARERDRPWRRRHGPAPV